MYNYFIRKIILKETYTSKCDALALEKINYHEIYKGKRLKRGLFSSSTNNLIFLAII